MFHHYSEPQFMMIDRETGELMLNTGERIGPPCTREAFLTSETGRGAREGVTNDPWYSYAFKLPLDDREVVYVTLLFHNSSLRNVDLTIANSGDPEEWSEGREMLRVARHTAWLVQSLGMAPPCHFSWGSIFSGYDPRSVSSAITIAYH